MKYRKIILFTALIFTACKSREKAEENMVAVAENSTTVSNKVEESAVKGLEVTKDASKIGPAKSAEQILIEEGKAKIEADTSNKLLGYWVGSFGKNKINIAIVEAHEDKASGYSVCAGNFRPIKGTVSSNGETFQFELSEPGDNKYDGTFTCQINLSQNELTGSWIPFKKAGNTEKLYSLKKTKYTFRPEVGNYPKASQELLTVEDVENIGAENLKLMRNEIYAKHGYSFRNKEMREFFEAQEWYVPMGVDIRDQLSEVEIKNIDLIYRYEEYFKENYDDYGR